MISLKVCSRIDTIIMGLTTWMNKCVVYVQIWVKRVSMEGNIMGFLREGMCWCSLMVIGMGFATTLNMWDLFGCLETDNLHRHLNCFLRLILVFSQPWSSIVKLMFF